MSRLGNIFLHCTYTALQAGGHPAERAQKGQTVHAHVCDPDDQRAHGRETRTSRWLSHESVAVSLDHYGNWIKETQKIAEDVSRDANARNDGESHGATESNEHRPDEFFGYALGHLITLSILVKLFWSLYQPLAYPLMGVADQFP